MAITTISVGAKVIAPVAKDLFVKALLHISKELSANVDSRLKVFNTETKAHNLFKKIYGVRKVKTLWQMEKPVDITSFYHTPKVSVGKNVKREVSCMDDIGIAENIVILGIAGQGKSMLMRQMCVAELAKGKRIPLFIELRKITRDTNLKQLIHNALEVLEIDTDPKIFDYLCKRAAVCLILDGFDEIADNHLSRTVADIELLSDKYNELKIVISSRPDSGTDGLRSFSTARICDLTGKEYQAVMLRLLGEDNGDLYDEIIDKIDSNKNEIEQFLTTPLMVTLLLIKYKLTKDIPENFAAFYDGVLEVFLTRHDGLKPGYTRRRKSSLNDHDFRVIFETLTFHLIGRSAIIGEDDLYREAQKAIEENNQSCRPDAFISDLIKITCLLLKDGRSYRFIHKSVQEYYSAAYISKKPEAWVKSLFDKVQHQGFYKRMESTINFLSELDRYKWSAYFLKPKIEDLLGGFVDGSESISDAAVRIFGSCSVTGPSDLKGEKFQTRSFRVNDNLFFLVKNGLTITECMGWLDKAFSEYLSRSSKTIGASSSEVTLTFGELIKSGSCQHMFPPLEKTLQRLHKRLISTNDYIGRSTAGFKGF